MPRPPTEKEQAARDKMTKDTLWYAAQRGSQKAKDALNPPKDKGGKK